jgi:hypothetical protein
VPLNSVQLYLRSVLDNVVLPLDQGPLTAYIQPPPQGDGTVPSLYIWGSRGDESRRTVPRAQPGQLDTGGHKVIVHDVDMWLVWLGPVEDERADILFPSMIDCIMAILRNVALLDQAQYATDPVTGQQSNLLDVGEQMSWEYAPVRAVADQRYQRYDARISVTVNEWFQA